MPRLTTGPCRFVAVDADHGQPGGVSVRARAPRRGPPAPEWWYDASLRGRTMIGVSTASVDVAWLDWLAEEAGAKVEVDAEGSIIVSPATDKHVIAANALHQQLLSASPAGTVVLLEGLRWTPTGSDRPSYIPDISVLDRRALSRREGVLTLELPPLLVAEIVSPESRRRDLGEKADAYFAGGAAAYWTVEVPGLTQVDVVELTARQRGSDGWEPVPAFAGGAAQVSVPFDVNLDLDALLV
jgi:Uma2 family endonuclease